jgi:glutamyl-tRNA synthetase
MFHVGGARSALQNWIYAQQHGGTFVLRIEDTDAARNRPEWTEGILSALDWIGIERGNYEGPYYQSSYADEHTAAATRLYSEGRAYYCDCTRDDVVARSGNKYTGYDGFCRDRGLGPGEGRALRFRTPDEGSTVVVDLVRGEPTFENKLIEDFVIARSDGTAVFLLANVVDDMTMGITHVIRAEEHLPNTPKQQLLWEALGVKPPVWAHVPVIVNEKRQKLSKRRDKVALEAYRDEGYLADAMVNYLMTLGWAPKGDTEIVPWSVIEDEFRLEDVTHSPAFFDIKKLTAFNGDYIRALPLEEFIAACEPWIPDHYDRDVFARIAPELQSRAQTLAEVPAQVDFLFAPPMIDQGSWDKAMGQPWAGKLLDGVVAAFEAAPWDAAALEAAWREVSESVGAKPKLTQGPVRVAVSGRISGPPLFPSLVELGRDETLARLRVARERVPG